MRPPHKPARISVGTGFWTLVITYVATAILMIGLSEGVHHTTPLLLAPGLIWASFHDWQTHEIPDWCSAWIACVGVGHSFYLYHSELWLNLATGAIVLIVLWGLGEVYYRLKKTEGLGIGDAKLFAAGAVVLGPHLVLDMICLASVGGIAAVLMRRYVQSSLDRGVAFGPFIAYAIFVLSFKEQTLL
ncbi:A24 family peptidase [uncultured Tateyamaria sp.]|uniref:prepilin peptidase n=1 Tax=uncultured Tateyamaria sp. TaxID=455651 RepID=UPI00260965EB|nr:A24 family peptidase [uncultured Tateyamaria sp.]